MATKPEGYRSQQTGAQAENKVRDALVDDGFTCSKLEIDKGEDFLVELDGYSPLSPEPRIAMLQVKGHFAEETDTADLTQSKRSISVAHLQRWAAHPCPVILIAVDLIQGKPVFFASSLDKLITQYAENGLAELSQLTVTMTLPLVQDLAGFVRRETVEFYEKNAFNLDGLETLAIERNHYVVLSKTAMAMPSTAEIRISNYWLLWKGPWRPAHFWASLNHFADGLQRREAGQRLPFMVNIHIYRSYRDRIDNNAVAHMCWVEEGHRDTDEIKAMKRFPKLTHWARFRFNYPASLHTVDDLELSGVGDDVFIEEAGRIWRELDRLFEAIVENMKEDGTLEAELLTELSAKTDNLRFDQVDRLGCPSPQFDILDKLLQSYASRIGDVLTWIEGKKNTTETERQRCLAQDIELATGFHKAFAPIEAHLSGREV